MATATASASATMPDVKKLTFAKVAASGSKEKQPTAKKTRAPVATPKDKASVTALARKAAQQAEVNQLADRLDCLKIGEKMPSLVVNGTTSTSPGNTTEGNVQTSTDDVSQKTDSNSELGTKPPSLDGKSMTSGTTFNALDEKESLRPDDSASVMAAAEDDDAFSIRGSLIAGSRMGSEVAGRVHRIQLGDMPPRSIPTHQTVAESSSRGIVTPQSASSDQQPVAGAVTDAKIALVTATSAPNELYGKNPDEKLLEAMQSQKDRIFLLKLEEKVIEFVQNSQEPFMDLPPSNSFCRLLTHKLADYYHMTHSFEGIGAVRIYRTPFCRVPPSLASIAQNASAASTPPPVVLPKKIMRRGEIGDSFPGSAGASKTTSEVGSDGKDKAKEKLTREEREEAYNKARERIFGTVSTEVSTPENEDSTGVSRASSVSGRDKLGNGKKGKVGKQRRDDSEAFEPRSKYFAHYGHPQQPTTWAQPHYMPVETGTPPYVGQVQQSYQSPMPSVYATSTQPYPPMMPSNGYGGPQYNNMSNFSQPPAQLRYQSSNGSMGSAPMPVPAPYGVPMQAPVPNPMQTPPQSQQGWQVPNGNSSPYQSRATPTGPGGIPYAFGALPVNVNPNDPKSQHPIPGSFNRAFNPRTQSFVPGNGLPSMPPPPPGTYNNGFVPPQQQGSPQIAPQYMNYNGYQAGPPMGQTPYASNGNGYGMMRQGSNNSLPPYPGPPHNPQYPQHLPQHAQQHVPHIPQLPLHPPTQGYHHLPQMPNKPAIPQGPSMHNRTFNNLPNYGNPATLPQKPST